MLYLNNKDAQREVFAAADMCCRKIDDLELRLFVLHQVQHVADRVVVGFDLLPDVALARSCQIDATRAVHSAMYKPGALCDAGAVAALSAASDWVSDLAQAIRRQEFTAPRPSEFLVGLEKYWANA